MEVSAEFVMECEGEEKGRDVSMESQQDNVQVRNFVSARIKEIVSLSDKLGEEDGKSNGFAFQHVKKHMRRRAVSHNPSRLPVRLRFAHLNQISKGDLKFGDKAKRPLSKHRKRTPKTIAGFNQRQVGNPLWLEGHVWHAKRFHMKRMWGKKVAFAPTAKCFRSLFFAAQRRSIMQDISYLNCFELSGPLQELLNGLNCLLPFGCEDFINKPISQNYNREIVGHIYSTSTPKSFYIGAVRFLWIPVESQDNQTYLNKIVMWTHPAIKLQLVEELRHVFQLDSSTEETQNNQSEIQLPQAPNKDEQKYLWKLLFNKSWYNGSSQIRLSDKTGAFNRIRLYGPKTLPILKDLFKIGSLPGDNDPEAQEKAEILKEKQEKMWKTITRIVNVPRNTVIPLNILDPRLELPTKRRSVVVSSETKVDPLKFPDNDMIRSQIWDDKRRYHVLHTRMSDERLAQIRGENLIPGTNIDSLEKPNVIPVVLIFRSGSHTRRMSSSFVGIDLILPVGWFMSFWVALSYRCVRAYGIEFSNYLTFEEDPHLSELSPSTIFSPDAIIHAEETEKSHNSLSEKYFARPPAKRQNLLKLGCPFPFSLDWARFLKFIFKNEAVCTATNDSDQVSVKVLRNPVDLASVGNFIGNVNSNELLLHDCVLYPVTMTLISGAVEDRSCILLPTVEDLKRFVAGRKRTDYAVNQEQLPDMNQSSRDTLSRIHQKRLALLRKKRKVARKVAANPPCKDFDISAKLSLLDSKEECNQHNEKMKKLWTYENDVDYALSKQSREPIGLITYAHFSFLRGKSAAVGYIPVGQLKKLVKVHDQSQERILLDKKGGRQIYVLVRNWTNSLICHWAKLNY